MGRFRSSVTFLIVLVATGSPLWGFSGLLSFGDSLSDVGNTYGATFGFSPGGPPYYNGRYSNGPVWVEDLAIDQGLAVPTNSRAGGLDYAYGGAETGTGNTSLVIWNLQKQVSTYLSGHAPSSTQLVTLWAGANDFFDGQTNAATPVNNIATSIGSLAAAGARTFLVPNLPMLGDTPEYRGTANQSTYDSLTLQFNTQLATRLTSLASTLNVQIYQLDVASFFNAAVSNPSAYGFTNVTDSAYNGSTVVSNPDQYLFWDGVHPTRVGHNLLAGVASDLLDTHNWIAGAGNAAWSASSSWDPSAAPSSRWIVNLVNNTGSSKTAVVSSNSTVRKISIGGSGARMQVQVQSGVTLSASDSLAMGSNGVIGVTLAGGGAQSKLSIGGAASLNGVLDVSLASGFVSLPGTSYQVMSFGSRSGDITVFNDTGLAGLSFDKSYQGTSLSLIASATGGDANLDGMIDVNDLDLLAQHWQSSGNWLSGDFDGNGFIDASDLGILALHWQGGGQALPAALRSVGLPEPELVGLLGAAALIASLRRRTIR